MELIEVIPSEFLQPWCPLFAQFVPDALNWSLPLHILIYVDDMWLQIWTEPPTNWTTFRSPVMKPAYYTSIFYQTLTLKVFPDDSVVEHKSRFMLCSFSHLLCAAVDSVLELVQGGIFFPLKHSQDLVACNLTFASTTHQYCNIIPYFHAGTVYFRYHRASCSAKGAVL